MPDHRAIAILDSFKSRITDLPLAGDRVYSGRLFEFSNAPSHSIYLGPANVDAGKTPFIDQTQLIRDEILVVGAESELDELLLNFHAEAYASIMADYTLGLAYVIDTVLESMSDPEYIDDGKRPALAAVFTWRVMYRHSISSVSA